MMPVFLALTLIFEIFCLVDILKVDWKFYCFELAFLEKKTQSFFTFLLPDK